MSVGSRKKGVFIHVSFTATDGTKNPALLGFRPAAPAGLAATIVGGRVTAKFWEARRKKEGRA